MKLQKSTKAFTLIELLTVIAVIAMLMAIFGMGAKKMKVIQRNLQQKAVFHSMEIGLELFSKDFDGYPGSEKIDEGGQIIVGSQRLQEALFGRDERGFHPKTKWHPSRDIAAPTPPYPGADLYTQLTEKDRKGPYMELKHGGIYTIDELWNNPATSVYLGSGGGTQRAALITDVFALNQMQLANGDFVKVGTPILYFKADSTKRFRVDRTNKPVNPAVYAEYKDWVFNFDNNHQLLMLNWLRENLDGAPVAGLQKHYYDPSGAKTTEQLFYESITERQEDMDKDGTDDFFRAFNSSSYLLISAGYDGIYGTRDDITNFNY